MHHFKPCFIEATTIDDCWFQLLTKTYNNGRSYIKSSGSRQGMKMYAFDFVSCFIHYPHTRPLAPIMPEGIPPVTTDEKIEQYFVDYLMNNKLSKNEHYRYSTWINGSRIEDYNKPHNVCHTDQLSAIINHFQIHGYGNDHCYLTVCNPDSILGYNIEYMYCNKCDKYYARTKDNKCKECGTELILDEALRPTSPCLRGLDFRIVDGYLTTNVIFRANDLWAWPENIGGITMLNEYISEHLDGVEPGPISYSCKSLHCPEDMFGVLELRIGK